MSESHHLATAAENLACALRDLTHVLQTSRCDGDPLTLLLHQFQKLQPGLNMLISELPASLAEIKAKVAKIADEQQKRYDEIKEKLDAALEELADEKVPASVTTALEEVQTLLAAFDDTILDTAGGSTASPAPGEDDPEPFLTPRGQPVATPEQLAQARKLRGLS